MEAMKEVAVALAKTVRHLGVSPLMEFAKGYSKERQPFRLKLGEVYEQLER
jgi:hypothetical protein